MNRAKMRKAVAALPPGCPDHMRHQALGLVRNPKTRQRVEARYRRQAAP